MFLIDNANVIVIMEVVKLNREAYMATRIVETLTPQGQEAGAKVYRDDTAITAVSVEITLANDSTVTVNVHRFPDNEIAIVWPGLYRASGADALQVARAIFEAEAQARVLPSEPLPAVIIHPPALRNRGRVRSDQFAARCQLLQKVIDHQGEPWSLTPNTTEYNRLQHLKRNGWIRMTCRGPNGHKLWFIEITDAGLEFLDD